MAPRTITPDLAARILASAATNGDLVSDVVSAASQVALASGKPVNTADVVARLRDDYGLDVDDDGFIR